MIELLLTSMMNQYPGIGKFCLKNNFYQKVKNLVALQDPGLKSAKKFTN